LPLLCERPGDASFESGFFIEIRALFEAARRKAEGARPSMPTSIRRQSRPSAAAKLSVGTIRRSASHRLRPPVRSPAIVLDAPD